MTTQKTLEIQKLKNQRAKIVDRYQRSIAAINAQIDEANHKSLSELKKATKARHLDSWQKRKAGWTYSKIGEHLGVSPSRAQQLAKAGQRVETREQRFSKVKEFARQCLPPSE